MPQIALAQGYWDLASERTDRLRLHNMLIGENKASPTGKTYRGRPGQTEADEVGDGPTRKMWRQEGTIGGQILTVSGADLYVGSTYLGFVGSEGVQIAGSDERAVIVASGKAWRTDGTTLHLIIMPDDVPGYEGSPAPVQSVRYINGFFLLAVKGTQRFYWIQPLQDDPDALDFASAERLPDFIVSIALSGDEIWMLGGEGEEVFAVTTDTDAPFQSIIGRVYNAGCADIDSVQEIGTVLAWVTQARNIAVARGEPQPVSDDAIVEILSPADWYKAWSFRMSGHAYYVLTTPDITLVFDFNAQTFYRWSSYERDIWRPITGCQIGAEVTAGDIDSGQHWTLGFDVTNDAGDPLVRELSGTVDVLGLPITCSSVSLRTVIGFGNGPLELKWSDNQGRSWSEWRQIPLGTLGQYDKDAIARSLGQMRRPGRTFVWRFSEDTPFRVDYASYNEA
jgi:hypothetical protein